MIYIESPQRYVGKGKSVFLAGGITNCPNWQQRIRRGTRGGLVEDGPDAHCETGTRHRTSPGRHGGNPVHSLCGVRPTREGGFGVILDSSAKP